MTIHNYTIGGYSVKYTLKKAAARPSLCISDSMVIEVNNEFIQLTGYSKNDLIGKSITEISCMLKIDSQLPIENIEGEHNYYIFNKESTPKKVVISSKSLKSENKMTYFFKEKLNPRIRNQFHFIDQLYTDKKTGIAIISFPDLILLKANQNYLNLLSEPFNKLESSIGKKQNEILTGNSQINSEKLWNSILNNDKPYYAEEIECYSYKSEITYLNLSITPIHINGNIKYIFITSLDVTEKVLNRKAIEKQVNIIRQQKEELETIIENMSDGLCIVDKNHNYSLLNGNAKKFIYCTDPIKKVSNTLCHTKYYDLDGNLLQYEDLPVIRALNGEKIKEFRFTCHRPDGIHHFNVSASPIYNRNGNIENVICCFHNVTEQLNKDELIKAQKEELELIIENMSDSLIVFDKHGNITKLNEAARDTPFLKNSSMKKPDDILENFQCYDEYGRLISKEDSIISRVLKGERFSEQKMAIKIDNSLINAEINATPIYNDKGAFIMGVLLSRNITDRIKSQEALLLKTQLDLLNNLIEHLDIGYARYSYPDFKIIDMNNKTYADLKLINPEAGPLSSLKGTNFCDIFNIDEKVKAAEILENLIKQKKGSYFTYKKVIDSGKELVFKSFHQPIWGLNNQIMEIIVIALDVTDEVAAKNKMKTALKTQEEIFSNVSHELKTPLNVIFSTNQLMEFYLENNLLETNKWKLSKGINTIKQNCYRFIKLINNIVDLSKAEAGYLKLNLSNENIVQITEDIVQSVSEYVNRKGLNIIFDTNVEEKIIACDPEKIERIILNLISNAVKFIDIDGKIFVNMFDKNDTIEITVQDTGIGIAEKHLNNIFERFQQVDKSLSRNAEGSGIGLSLVKSIIEMHGGKISVKSTVGKGSTFKIELPAKTLDNPKVIKQNKPMNDKIETINIEFSDIYSI